MTSLPASPPHPGAVDVRRWTLDDVRDLHQLRAALRTEIARVTRVAGAELGEVLDRAVIVATELATNALRHGRPPAEVRLQQAQDRLVLVVVDHAVDAVPRLDDDRPPGAGGLGMRFVRTLAVETGWYTRDGAKHVWASFPG
ncbi:ATP-binding protein [Spirilliplanes yamanashiensis]|uniref:Histidine kinase/HSP90-like ATPase domain-containing protein n=1 Tax=Spirilliplanes yamanashiensis TaxID=42233 RepID=A0A8J3Y8N1_9ACTN|nr:ATP-binding protein [Spirilliplanes yamanashiensis]MDP9815694.1 anti-sigma regulatory factor (Ser/Thr protein kinase) [Spirilliplanes yamanashiensis]GIJ03948.1 hypothetical protein Sya03_33000 [Spirilliplanes yamanashiensis]